MRARVGLVAGLGGLVAIGVLSPAAADGSTRLDGEGRQRAVFHGQVEGACVGQLATKDVPVPVCTAGAVDRVDLVLERRRGFLGDLRVRVAAPLTNAGLTVSVHDAKGNLVGSATGLQLVGYGGGRVQSEANLLLPRMRPGAYRVSLSVNGGVAAYEQVVTWTAAAR